MIHMKKIFFLAIVLCAFQGHGQNAVVRGKELFGDLRARHIGPALMSGRITDIELHPTSDRIIYAGTGGGGVWKSNNGGATFNSIFDDYCQSIGAIELDPSNPDLVVWVGTGEVWTRNSVSIGDGIYRSNDGGNSWQNMGLEKSERISGIQVNPKNPNEVYVAVLGALWNDSEERGLYKTTDGGKTWNKILYVDKTTGCSDLILDPVNPDIIYASFWEFRRTPWSFNSGGNNSALFKSTDGGKTWIEIISGLSNDPINSVKEDPKVRGLLFCGSERFVNVSFDDGSNWQSLKMNMPPTSIRDLVIKDDDIVLGTHGRSFWIMDNITPLRQLAASKTPSENLLFEPQVAWRVRWNTNPDTPLPQEEPGGENPPEGAMIDYYLNEDISGEISLDILDLNGTRIRHYSSLDKPYNLPELNIPLYWIRPWLPLASTKGHHRFLWDLHHEPIANEISFPMSAIYKNTAPAPTAPWVMPGEYIVRLSVSGKTYEKRLNVIMDPRVTTSTSDLKERYELSMIAYRGHIAAHQALNSIEVNRKQITALPARMQKNRTVTEMLADLSIQHQKMQEIVWNWERLFGLTQESDTPVTSQLRTGIQDFQKVSETEIKNWKTQKHPLTTPAATHQKNSASNPK